MLMALALLPTVNEPSAKATLFENEGRRCSQSS